MTSFFGVRTFEERDDKKPQPKSSSFPKKNNRNENNGQRKPRKPVYTPNEDGTPPSEKTMSKLRSRGTNYCYYMLGEGQRTEQYLRERLTRRGYPAELIDEIMNKLRTEGYVDDAEYARAFTRDKQRFDSKGTRAIGYELQRKGIDPETVKEVMEEYHDPDDEEARARKYAEGRVRSTRSVDRQKRTSRLVSALARRGYDASTSYRIVKEVIDQDVEEEAAENEEE